LFRAALAELALQVVGVQYLGNINGPCTASQACCSAQNACPTTGHLPLATARLKPSPGPWADVYVGGCCGQVNVVLRQPKRLRQAQAGVAQ